MFNAFLPSKTTLLALALLIVGSGAFFLARPQAAEAGIELIVQAWQAAFGDFDGNGPSMEVPLVASSTILAADGQENGEQGGANDAFAWPSLLIETKSSSDKPKMVAVAETPAPSSSSRQAANDPGPVSPQWCDFQADKPGNSGVILNEIAWMGSVDGPNDEWLELRKYVATDLDVSDWQILNQSGSIQAKIAASFSSDGFILLERGEDYSGALNNSGDWLKIFDRDCRVVDELNALDGWPAGDNATKKTLERDADGGGWHSSAAAGGSPAAENSENFSVVTPTSTVTTTPITATSTQDIPPLEESGEGESAEVYPPAYLVIAEAQITGGEGATERDYIKIFNPTPASIDVSGWKLRKRTKTGTESSIKVFPDGSRVEAGDYFAWANSADGWSAAIGANVSSTQTIAADNSIALLDAAGVLVDALAWGGGHTSPYIEGGAYPENPAANQRLSRKFQAGNIRDSGNNTIDFELKP